MNHLKGLAAALALVTLGALAYAAPQSGQDSDRQAAAASLEETLSRPGETLTRSAREAHHFGEAVRLRSLYITLGSKSAAEEAGRALTRAVELCRK